MDSLMTVRLRGRLQEALGLRLPPTVAFEHPTVDQLAAHLDAVVAPQDGPAPAPPPPDADGPAATGGHVDRDAYSDEELVALLARKLEEIG
jgi:hypothetical protein